MGHVNYQEVLDDGQGVSVYVEFRTSGPKVESYSVVLLLETDNGIETIRLYDSAHGFNEMHRYRQGDGKQRGVPFHPGSLGEGMRAAVKAVEEGYVEMIEGWRGSE